MKMFNEIARYFDLQSAQRVAKAVGHSGGASPAPVIPQYFALALGIIVQPFLRNYIATNAWDFDLSILWGRVLFGLAMGIVLLPSVYKSSFDPKKPILVQLAALFPLGIGWQALFTSAARNIGG